MSVRGWSWDAEWGPAAVGDRPLLEALEVALPDEVVEAAIEATGTREHRRRRLPTHLVVTLVVAMGVWASESMRHALAEVVAGWREQPQARRTTWELPSTAAIVQARRRAGARLFRVLFQSVAGPIATAKTKGAFLGGLRLMAVDGTTLDLADTPANEQAFVWAAHHPPRACHRSLSSTPRSSADRDRHPRAVRRGHATVPLRGAAGRPAPAAVDRTRHAAPVGPRLPLVCHGPGDPRAWCALPGSDQERRHPGADRALERWL